VHPTNHVGLVHLFVCEAATSQLKRLAAPQLRELPAVADIFSALAAVLDGLPAKCPSIDAAGFITTTTDQGKSHSLQIDGQAHSPELPSLREATVTTYGAAVWRLEAVGQTTLLWAGPSLIN